MRITRKALTAGVSIALICSTIAPAAHAATVKAEAKGEATMCVGMLTDAEVKEVQTQAYYSALDRDELGKTMRKVVADKLGVSVEIISLLGDKKIGDGDNKTMLDEALAKHGYSFDEIYNLARLIRPRSADKNRDGAVAKLTDFEAKESVLEHYKHRTTTLKAAYESTEGRYKYFVGDAEPTEAFKKFLDEHKDALTQVFSTAYSWYATRMAATEACYKSKAEGGAEVKWDVPEALPSKHGDKTPPKDRDGGSSLPGSSKDKDKDKNKDGSSVPGSSKDKDKNKDGNKNTGMIIAVGAVLAIVAALAAMGPQLQAFMAQHMHMHAK